ncbi:class I SAM-dependent methyltransferase [Leptolyngbya sp. NK1-12]|uniref:Class I SAM-dependent methyltransferase n=1 Tax=Leptolyngbya sp. NK1-12 TaxID=2547451 RepID=A0AA97AP28_9CYAN|nr:class I SAM-dependent methyltransferase [Leptolyngbya sp. NK1-12]WNZ27452.1 class I SAM-dependent methyltransferase [Leptolyngbya sp. NK1-12]
MTDPPKPIGERNYQQFAERYAAAVETKAHNAYYERPATLSLLPDVAGLRILDAGCGPGIYSEWLLQRGALVVACDVTPQMVAITKRRLGIQEKPEEQRVKVYQADITQPLNFADDGSFDLVLCPLVLDNIADWHPVFAEFVRVLHSGGRFVFSCGNPTADFIYTQSKQLTLGNYFEVEQFTMEWRGFGEPYPVVTSYRRSWQAVLNPLIEAGFVLEQILEPQPTEQFRLTDPVGYAKLMCEPGFLCIRARKP